MNPLFRSPYLSTFIWLLFTTLFLGGTAFLAMAQEQPVSNTHQQQAMDISKVLRCPMATNLSLFESQAPIAHELKAQIFSMLEQGDSQDEIILFMVQRYGEKIRYQPELKGSTVALWFGPLLLLLVGVGICLGLIKR
ncbi:MAG: cytochrome c-type biogenesis protein CcmH [Gammaproteobacteria bacterium]|jgi:formate-dependent nitrite reductase complex subunit NrfF|nr:cytochrome c-type biogenesis protein CcmH [Gammaproteobacteria bacterium]MBU1478856.1 cytochrome c-type biogenesis protein CcmH [Gammaproteobacteria bacterium]MBU2003240.1 cytochrome c-type biogenesis protein CcmH [Gammaproteobacteria bacterium]MBU2132692.1 cytochrome c-type biogenesis protein CcmH [Gammaproteobacteria bacterium]MBU2188300.1 cytochrome c-type biogenesis protein CcmH [Gammaproteobacteria bacterium]